MRPNKPYKAIDPILTINFIRNILTECGVFLIEEHRTEFSSFYSSRLTVSNNGLFMLNLGTNGKGLTLAYSLASAYAEFMERLQNNFIFLGLFKNAKKTFINNENNTEFSKILLSNDLVLDFTFDPKEKIMSYDELTQNQTDIFNYIAVFSKYAFLAIKANDNQKFLFAPFYDVKERCSEYLPIGLLLFESGSNGMCAGNTKEEAIIHGICEIFERYVLKIIYKDEITPPTIPSTLFKGTKIHDLLSQLEDNNNITVLIKDCSLNKGLPVIGLIIIDHDSNSFTFKLGADPSPVIALERCFTELFQGQNLEESLRSINITKDPFEKSSLKRIICKNNEFFKFYINGKGKLPNSILSSNYSYSFNVLNHDLNKNDKEDLKYLLGKIDELGFNTYIRDVSFLNFPSYYVYIPGMSEGKIHFDVDVEKQRKFNYSLLNNLKNRSIEEYINIAEILEELFEETSKQKFNLSPYNIHEDNQINNNFLLALIYYRISNYTKSYENLNIMIDSFNDEEKKQNIYLLCSRDYIYCKSKGFNNAEIVNCLKYIYKNELLMDVIHDLENEENVFQYQNFPTCFNCEDCEIKNGCRYFDVLKILKNIQEKHKMNPINQDTLKWITEL